MRRPDPEIRGRLAVLVGSNDKVDATVEKYRSELNALWTVKVRNSSKQDGKAEFFQLLATATDPLWKWKK